MTTQSRKGDPIWAVMLGFVLLLVLLVVGIGGAAWFARDYFTKSTSPEAVDAAFAADPYAAPMLTAIREDFPEEYAKLRDTLSQSARRGAPPLALRAETFSLLRQAALAHLDELTQAPHDKLAAFNAAERRMIEKLEADNVVLCGQYIMRGFAPGDTLSPDIRAQVSDMGVAQWRASAAGRDWPANRTVPTVLSTRDSLALVAAMRKQGMSDRDLQIFATPALLARAEPWRQCALGKWLIAAIGTLPPEQSDRVAGWLIQQKRMN